MCPSLEIRDWELAVPLFQSNKYAANEVLLYAGQICRYIYFLETGLVRCHAFADGRTLWCEFEGAFVFVPQSFFLQTPSHEVLSFIEPSVVYALHYKDLQQLYAKNMRWAQWGVKFMEREYLKIETIYQPYFIWMIPNATRRLFLPVPMPHNVYLCSTSLRS